MTSTDSTSAFGHQALDELPLLTALAPEARELVVASFVRARYEFGETLVAAGDAPDGFYVVCSGMARVLVAGRDGEEVSLNLLRAGDSFGEVGLLDGSPRTATVRAASDVEALRLDAAVFDALVRLHPEISDAFALQSRRAPAGRLPPCALGVLAAAWERDPPDAQAARDGRARAR